MRVLTFPGCERILRTVGQNAPPLCCLSSIMNDPYICKFFLYQKVFSAVEQDKVLHGMIVQFPFFTGYF